MSKGSGEIMAEEAPSPRPNHLLRGQSPFARTFYLTWEQTIVSEWVEVCSADHVETEEVIRFDSGGSTFAIYRSPDGNYFATDGLCTHEKIHLADGLVMDDIIECPKHNGRFNYKTGQARGAPVCINLKTYPVKVDAGKVFIRLG
jgi:3-phenylpropionate/trans-cinnamate dioxygenase ferredoxin component